MYLYNQRGAFYNTLILFVLYDKYIINPIIAIVNSLKINTDYKKVYCSFIIWVSGEGPPLIGGVWKKCPLTLVVREETPPYIGFSVALPYTGDQWEKKHPYISGQFQNAKFKVPLYIDCHFKWDISVPQYRLRHAPPVIHELSRCQLQQPMSAYHQEL